MRQEERSAVALAVVIHDEAVLALKRCDADAGLEWVFPGGKIERNESARAAARRELREETGLLGYKPSCIGWRVHPLSERAVYYIALRCEAREVSLEDKFAEAEWIPISEIVDRMGDHIYGGVLSYLAPLCTETLDRAASHLENERIGTLVYGPALR